MAGSTSRVVWIQRDGVGCGVWGKGTKRGEGGTSGEGGRAKGEGGRAHRAREEGRRDGGLLESKRTNKNMAKEGMGVYLRVSELIRIWYYFRSTRNDSKGQTANILPEAKAPVYVRRMDP